MRLAFLLACGHSSQIVRIGKLHWRHLDSDVVQEHLVQLPLAPALQGQVFQIDGCEKWITHFYELKIL